MDNTTHTNVASLVHADDFATVAMTESQMVMLQTILDVAREDICDDDEEREEVALFAEALFQSVSQALTQHQR